MSQSTKPLAIHNWNYEKIPDQTGKTIIITGSNSGLGFVAAKALASKGAEVVIAARNEEKASDAINKIKAEVSDATLNFVKIDLASLGSIREFADEINNIYEKIDVLLNNAGIMQPPYLKTEDGFEIQFGVNHLGHFALTSLLFKSLKGSPQGRVVNVSSIAATRGKINFVDLNSEQKYNKTTAYGQSKIANLYFTYELSRRIKAEGIDVIAAAAHPGYSRTNLQSAGPSVDGKSAFYFLYKVLNPLLAQSVNAGTLPLLYASVGPDVENGDYFGPRRFGHTRGPTVRHKSVEISYDPEIAKELWKRSEELTGIKFKI